MPVLKHSTNSEIYGKILRVPGRKTPRVGKYIQDNLNHCLIGYRDSKKMLVAMDEVEDKTDIFNIVVVEDTKDVDAVIGRKICKAHTSCERMMSKVTNRTKS